MTQAMTKPKKIWGSQKVFMSGNELIINGRNYPFAQTLGAFVEPVPAPPKPAANQQPATKTNVLAIIGGIILILLVLIFVAWWSDSFNDYNSGGASTKYRLVLVSQSGPIVVLEHRNKKKLDVIASQVNQSLINRGINPMTGYQISNLPYANPNS